jgi:hypothetical protein
MATWTRNSAVTSVPEDNLTTDTEAGRYDNTLTGTSDPQRYLERPH